MAFDVDGVLFLELVLLVAGDEGEGVDVLVEFGQRELQSRRRGVCRRAAGRAVLGLQIVQGDAGEIGDDDVARDFLVAALRRRS